jgi:GT2 family glycosyltransferase
MAENINGHVDGVSAEGWLGGWARSGGSGGKVQLHIAVDGQQIASVTADQFRADLAEAKFLDPSCAFVYKIPDEFRDNRPHTVEVLAAATGSPLQNSPLPFVLRNLVTHAGAAEDRNLVPNAKLSHWPDGSFLKPMERFAQLAAGWYFDFKKGSSPNVAACIDRPAGLGLREDEYALKMTLGTTEGYRRIVIPIETSAASEGGRFLFSCGFRRPHTSVARHVTIPEVFLGTLEGSDLNRIASIKKRLALNGTVRVTDVPVVITTEMMAGLEGQKQMVLGIELQGEGELLIFSPRLTRMPILLLGNEGTGQFEDPRIQDQSNLLPLPPSWTRRATTSPSGSSDATKLASLVAQDDQTALPRPPLIQIIVPVFNAAHDTGELLASVEEHTSLPYEILLFDDGSDAHTKDYLRRLTEHNPRVTIFSHEENVGYTRNINIAVQASTADFVVILNSDTIVTPRWLEKLYEVITRDPQIAAVGPLSNAASYQSIPQVKAPDGTWAINPLPPGLDIDQYSDLVEGLSEAQFPDFPLLNGFCTLFRRAALEQVGLFDDNTFPRGYGEENDLCIRLGQAGFRLCVADHTFVYHKKSKSFGSELRKEISREASGKLRAKFPDLRIDQLESQMAANAALNILRMKLLTFNPDEHRVLRSDVAQFEQH